MFATIASAALQGIDAELVHVEVNAGEAGEPKWFLVGLPDTAVKESSDRVFAALNNSGFHPPRTRTTINLAPADIKKEGPSFDLPIAIGMVAAAQRAELPRLERCLVAGELALTGEIRAIKGALPIAIEARNRGKKAVLLPAANAPIATKEQSAHRKLAARLLGDASTRRDAQRERNPPPTTRPNTAFVRVSMSDPLRSHVALVKSMKVFLSQTPSTQLRKSPKLAVMVPGAEMLYHSVVSRAAAHNPAAAKAKNAAPKCTGRRTNVDSIPRFLSFETKFDK